MNEHTDGDPLAELAALRQRLDKLEAEHSEFQRNASRRPVVPRKFLLSALAVVLVLAGGLLGQVGQQAMSLFIDPNGNVGIGTSTANNRLTVNGSASFGGTASITGAEPVEVQGVGAGYSLYDRAGGAKERWVMYSKRTGEEGTNTLRFWSIGKGDIAAITSGGNLGIGTNDPQAPMHINLSKPATPNANSELISRWTRPAGSLKHGNAFDILLGSYGTAPLQSQTRVDFRLDDGITGSPDKIIMTLQGNGNVGIGTTSPDATLEVVGPVMDKFDVIQSPNDGKDWTLPGSPLLDYFKKKLKGKPLGTHIRAISNNPGLPTWADYIWEGWVAADGKIKVMHFGPTFRIVNLQ